MFNLGKIGLAFLHSVCWNLFKQNWKSARFISYEVLDTLKSFSRHLSKELVYKCGFPLAKERKKRKTFFSHTVGSLSTSVWGFRPRGLCKVQFLFCHPPLPDMPHPSTREVALSVLILEPLFCVFVRQICCYALWFGLAWLPAVREKQSFEVIWLKWAMYKSSVFNKTD